MIRKIWRSLTKPVFNVALDKESTTTNVIAGETTKICTITIYLHANQKLGNRQGEIIFPRPIIDEVPAGVEISFVDETFQGRDALQIEVFVRATACGVYSITPTFPKKKYNIKLNNTTPVDFLVIPADADSLELRKLAPVLGHGTGHSIYRGGKAELWIKIRDKFGNQTVLSNYDFKIFPENSRFVTLLSTIPYVVSGKIHGYLVTLRCDNNGRTSLGLLLPNCQLQLEIQDLEILPPPVSFLNSYVSYTDNINTLLEKRYLAGNTIAASLVLYDVFGNPISFEESILFHDICLVCRHVSSSSNETKTSLEEEDSLKVCSSESIRNACDLEFTPYISGKRVFHVNVDRNKIKNSSLNITVVPGPLKELQVVSQEPSSLSIYRSRTAEIRVHVKDQYGNKYTGNDVNWKMISKDSSVALLSVTYDSEKENYVVTVRGEKAGATSFNLISSQGVCSVIKSISLHIIIPPVSHSNSYILQNEIVKLQKRIHKAGKAITFQLKLIDIFGNAISFGERGDFPENARLVYLCDDPSKWMCPTGNNSKRKENTSLTLRPSVLDSTVCELVFTPLVPGKRSFYLEIAGKKMKNSTIKLAILPGKDQQVEVEECQGFEISGGDISSIPYKQHDYFEFYEDNRSILCMGVPRRLLVGADLANIKNTNRVLEKQFSEDCQISSDMVSRGYGSVVLFELDGFTETAALKVMELLSILVEGEHYCRNQANEFANQREKWEEKENEAIEINYYREVRQFRDLKFKCGRLMNESNENASDAVFKFYNYGRPQSEIDLHGQRVANPDSLKS